MNKKILFVCTGNLCRSPMAEYLFRRVLEEEEIENIEVSSAGVMGLQQPATKEAILALKKYSIDLSPHRARLLTKDICDEADLILCMERMHREVVIQMSPEAKSKTKLLGGFDPRNTKKTIPDPIGESQHKYFETLQLIEKAAPKLIRYIRKNLVSQ